MPATMFPTDRPLSSLLDPATIVLEQLVPPPKHDPNHKNRELEPTFVLQKLHASYDNLLAKIRANSGEDEDRILFAVQQLFVDAAGVAVLYDKARQRN